MKANPVLNKSVLVTGCSSGIGRATAWLLRDRGWKVFPTARKDKDLQRLREEGFEPIVLDVADETSMRIAVDEVLRRTGGTLGALVNNAGYGQPGAVEDLTREALRRQFEVNVFGLQDLTNQLMPVFLKQGYGRIVHVSSVLGRIVIPMMGAYCASKHAVEALADAMRIELRGSGIAVSLVEPGPIETSFRDTSHALAKEQVKKVTSRFLDYYRKQIEHDSERARPERVFQKPPEAVARKILHALEAPNPKRRYRVTMVTYVGEFMRRFLPYAVMDKMMQQRLRE
jgi:NAD(P)-dependent dehydrogenase (short-subunit alcohol dehydrogenase family)